MEHLLSAKSGRGREYHFDWDEEGNQLTVTVLAPLPTDIAAQRFVTAPGETVLGFTDPTEVQRTLPLTHGEERRDVPPVVWRTGIRSTASRISWCRASRAPAPPPCCVPSRSRPWQHGDILVVEARRAPASTPV
ncbi:FtsK domain-containing protein OS=Streptomyces glaucescens OX=1907 GN=SGLAU_05685 PE=4 SV=1 [Streptomyces glaucescens]